MARKQNPLLTVDSIAHAVLLVLSSVSGLLTYQGMKETFLDVAAGWLAHVAVAAVALAITLIIYLFWRTAFRAADALKRGGPLLAGMCITLAFLPVILGMSSWFNVAGTAGARAIERHLMLEVGRMEEVVAQHLLAGLAIERFAPLLQLEAERYRRAAVGECSGGERTGKGGEGTICFTLRGVAKQLTTLGDEQLPALIKQAQRAGSEAQSVLDAMRKAATGAGGAAEKAVAVARSVDQLRQTLVELDSAKALTLIRAGVGALPAEVDKLPLSAKTPAGRAAQRAALDALKAELSTLVKRFEAEIDANAVTTPERLPTLEPLNAAMAVFRYRDHYVPFWVAGAALDLMPLAILLFLLVQRATLTDEELARREVLGLTLRDQLLSAQCDRVKRAPGPGQSVVTETVGTAFGMPPRIGHQPPDAAMPETDRVPEADRGDFDG